MHGLLVQSDMCMSHMVGQCVIGGTIRRASGVQKELVQSPEIRQHHWMQRLRKPRGWVLKRGIPEALGRLVWTLQDFKVVRGVLPLSEFRRVFFICEGMWCLNGLPGKVSYGVKECNHHRNVVTQLISCQAIKSIGMWGINYKSPSEFSCQAISITKSISQGEGTLGRAIKIKWSGGGYPGWGGGGRGEGARRAVIGWCRRVVGSTLLL